MQREHWHLTEGLIFVHFAVFILGSTNYESLKGLALFPGQVAARPWTLVTYQFISGSSMFWFFISMLVLWIMARPLEESWGSPRFLVFWLISTLGASGTAVALGQPLVGSIGFTTCLLFTFATLYPEVEFRIFFLIPVKVKYLAVISGAFLVFSGLSLGLGAGIAYVVGMSSGYLFFLATRRLPTRRKLAFEIKKRRAVVTVNAESAHAEGQNSVWDPNVRAAEARAREFGEVAAEDQEFLAELDAAKTPGITICAPAEFGYIVDDVCRGCAGFAECAARHIRLAAESEKEEPAP